MQMEGPFCRAGTSGLARDGGLLVPFEPVAGQAGPTEGRRASFQFHWSPAAASPRYLWERPGEKGLRRPRPPQIAGNSPTGRRPPY